MGNALGAAPWSTYSFYWPHMGFVGSGHPRLPEWGANKRFCAVLVVLVMGRSHTGLNPRAHRRLKSGASNVHKTFYSSNCK